MSSQTPSQTVGPYFAIGLTPEIFGRRPLATNQIAPEGFPGERIHIEGTVFDGEGKPVEDAMIEIWQADSAGRYLQSEEPKHSFRGFGRTGTSVDGKFSFNSVKPGPIPGPGNSWQAPHLNVIVFARGLLTHVYTRIYFDDETERNEADPILALAEPERRGTLIARRESAAGAMRYRFDIHLQGPSETVFLEA